MYFQQRIPCQDLLAETEHWRPGLHQLTKTVQNMLGSCKRFEIEHWSSFQATSKILLGSMMRESKLIRGKHPRLTSLIRISSITSLDCHQFRSENVTLKYYSYHSACTTNISEILQSPISSFSFLPDGRLFLFWFLTSSSLITSLLPKLKHQATAFPKRSLSAAPQHCIRP